MIASPNPTPRLFVTGRPPSGRDPAGGADPRLSAALLAAPVLIIEDEAMISWMLESLLEDLGFADISIASTGANAIAEASRHTPMLILSDINLGADELDGIGAVSAIMREAAPAVVFITGYASAEANNRIARDVPEAVLLRKPVQAQQLSEAIVQIDQRRQSN